MSCVPCSMRRLAIVAVAAAISTGAGPARA